MTKTALDRRQTLRQLVRTSPMGSQEQVLLELRALGFEVTQATVSRDLDQLGAIKVRRDGRVIYALPEDADRPASSDRQRQAILREWVRSVEAVGDLIVVKTPPGSAHLVGVAIDDARSPHIAGTICGDDTIFVAVRSRTEVDRVVGLISGEENDADREGR